MTRAEGAFAVDLVKVVLSETCIFMGSFLGSNIWRDSQVLMSLWKGEISALHLFILQPDGGMCNTEVPATTPLLYSFTGIISLCLMMWMKLY